MVIFSVTSRLGVNRAACMSMFTPTSMYWNWVLTSGLMPTPPMPGWNEPVATGTRSPIFREAFCPSTARICGCWMTLVSLSVNRKFARRATGCVTRKFSRCQVRQVVQRQRIVVVLVVPVVVVLVRACRRAWSTAFGCSWIVTPWSAATPPSAQLVAANLHDRDFDHAPRAAPCPVVHDLFRQHHLVGRAAHHDRAPRPSNAHARQLQQGAQRIDASWISVGCASWPGRTSCTTFCSISLRLSWCRRRRRSCWA